MSELVATPPPSPLLRLDTPGGLDRLRQVLGLPLVRRALPWFAGAGAIGLAAVTWAILSPAPQRILYSELDDQARSSVVTSLDKAGIAYAIDNQTGTLTVAEDDLYRARMLVAADGSLASPDPASALDNLPLGASRTLEGERMRAAREHELTLTIEEIDGVEGVRVHLAEANKSVFVRDDAPPSASVMVRMAKGRQLAESQVGAIVNLVAGSVPGMAAEAVRVIDQRGRLLSQGKSADSDRLEMQSRLEDKLRAQLETLLTPMLGNGNFSSEIQVDLDMDQITSARERFDKDGVVRSETQQQSQQSGAAGTAVGVPGQLSNTPPAPTTVKPGQPSPAPASPVQPAGTTGESSTSRNYELGREVSVADTRPGRIRRISVAVAISQEALKKARAGDVEQIKALVGAAMGIDLQRGDQIQVLVRPFEPAPEIALPFYETPWFAMVVRSLVALLAVVLVLVLAVRPLIQLLRRRTELRAADELAASESAIATRPALDPETGAVDTMLLGRQVDLAQRIVTEKPDEAIDALRGMLGQSRQDGEND